MTPREAVALCRYVAALCPAQRFDEYTPDTWHDVLGDLSFEDAQAAAREVGQRQAFIAPAEIRAAVRRVRSGRLAADFEEAPDADPDDVPAYLAAQRAGRRRTADGSEKPRDVAGALAGVITYADGRSAVIRQAGRSRVAVPEAREKRKIDRRQIAACPQCDEHGVATGVFGDQFVCTHPTLDLPGQGKKR